METVTVNAALKESFNLSLEPVKAMLLSRKQVLSSKAWHTLVRKTIDSIVRCPEQYLRLDIIPSDNVTHIVKEIFQEFVEEEMQEITTA